MINLVIASPVQIICTKKNIRRRYVPLNSSKIAVKNKNEGNYENTNFKKIINLDY